MSLRPIKLPQDFDTIERLGVDSFHYPDHPEWNMEQEEIDSIADMVKQYKKVWFWIKLLGNFSYQIRNFNVGYIWEEADVPAGVIFNHSSIKEEWWISTLGVLPEFRRRGIARNLLEYSINDFKSRGAKRAFLSVITDNLPARNFYLKSGFVEFSGDVEMEHPGAQVDEPILLTGYSEKEMNRFDGQTKFVLADKITPDEVKQFAPLIEKDFHTGFLMRLATPIIDQAEGVKHLNFAYYSAETNEILGRFGIILRIREGGMVHAFLRLAPRHPALAEYMFRKMLHIASKENPGRKLVMSLPIWQEEAINAAKNAGFTPKVEYREMALNLEEWVKEEIV